MLARIKAFTKTKVGGVPVLYILLFGVVGLAVYAWQTSNIPYDEGDTGDADPTDPESADGDAPGNEQPVFVANPSATPVAPSPDITDPVTVDSNDLWLKRGVAWLIQTGQANGGTAQNVLSKYLAGDTLSYSEGALRDATIKQFGLPPEVPNGAPTGAKPASRQFSSFPGTHTVKGASDNTYGELAQLYYGRNDGTAIDLIQSVNMSAGSGGPFAIGTKIKIPRWSTPKYYRATSARNTAAAIAKANGISIYALEKFNDGVKFPVKIGTRVRVG